MCIVLRIQPSHLLIALLLLLIDGKKMVSLLMFGPKTDVSSRPHAPHALKILQSQ